MKYEVTTVACLGSSTTAGKGQAFDWIDELRRRPRNKFFRFLNFGVGGDLAYNALRRLPKLIASRPDRIVVLIGGNDVLASASNKVRLYSKIFKHLPCEPSPEWLRENLTAIACGLKEQTSARIAFCSLPPIGEDPDSQDPLQREINRLIQCCNTIILELCGTGEVSYLPLYEKIHKELVSCPSRALTSFRFLPFYRDAFRVLVLRRSGDEIARTNGWRFHTDGIHLNSRSGMILANLVQEFLDCRE